MRAHSAELALLRAGAHSAELALPRAGAHSAELAQLRAGHRAPSRRLGRASWLLVAALAIGALGGCKRRQPPPRSRAPLQMPKVDHPDRVAEEEIEPPHPVDREFWNWFQAHAGELAGAQRGSPVERQLHDLLRTIDRRLDDELVARGAGHELILSADGVKAAFPVVRRLVAAAPTLPGWKVIAFRPRDPSVTSVELVGGVRVDATQITFEVLPSSYQGGTIDVGFFVPGITGSDLDGDMKVRQAMYLLLQKTLGEHDLETRLGGVLFEPQANAGRGARPFRELRDLVDHWK